jgi:outer membrane protein
MNRKIQAVLFTLALTASAAIFAQAAPATTAAATPSATAASGPAKIGVIDIQTAILATNEGQKEFTTLQTKFQPKKTELENKQKEIEGLQKQVDTQGNVLTDDARNNLVRSLETKKKDYQRDYEDASSDFDNQKNDILRTLGNKVYATLDKYAKANGFSVIVDVSSPQSPILWASQATNITKAIVDAYNVSSGVPAPAAPAAAPKPTAGVKPPVKPSGSNQ